MEATSDLEEHGVGVMGGQTEVQRRQLERESLH